MRGIILWAAVGIAAIVTGLGLYAAALQTSPAAITNPAPVVEPVVEESAQPTSSPSSDDHEQGEDREDREDRDRSDHDD